MLLKGKFRVQENLLPKNWKVFQKPLVMFFLRKMGSEIQWIHSYVVEDKIYCVYVAPNEEMVREHARLGGFPANSVSRVSTIIDPVTAE